MSTCVEVVDKDFSKIKFFLGNRNDDNNNIMIVSIVVLTTSYDLPDTINLILWTKKKKKKQRRDILDRTSN